ncbi:DNA helicase [Tanacetum coccineum]
MRGLPHCHTLLWIDESERIRREEYIDVYILAKLPPEDIDSECYRIVLELMMNRPCGLAEPVVQVLSVHLQNLQRIIFKDKEHLGSVVSDDHKKNTTLIEWLPYNEHNTDGRHLTYLNFPPGFVWYADGKYWRRRHKMNKSLIGCTSFPGIRTNHDIVYPTCRAACEALGLLEDDQECETTLQEAALTATLAELCTLLAHILTFCQVSDPYLIENMRLNNQELQSAYREKVTAFAQWLLDVRNGHIGTPDESDPENTSWIDIPEEYCIPNDENRISNLINFIYDDDTLHYPSAVKLQENAIVCSKNNIADVINAKILSLLLGTTRAYISYDDAIPHGHDGGEVELLYPKEYLNTLPFPGLPPHMLELKVGTPIMLL